MAYRSKGKVAPPEWPRGVFAVTEAEYRAANAVQHDADPGAWQVVRYCAGWAFHGDLVKEWLSKYRETHRTNVCDEASERHTVSGS